MNNNIDTHKFATYFNYYISLVKNNPNLIENLEQTHIRTKELVAKLTEEKGNYAYDKGKWTIKELLIHLIDTERIFCNRALRFARNDKTDLPGYDHDNYVNYCNAENRTLTDIMDEFNLVRLATIALFRSFTDEMLERNGTANGNELTVLAIGFVIAGHEVHHTNVLLEKYLI